MKLFNEDCLEGMKKLEANSVDMMFADLPYGVTHHKWDIKINLEIFWKEVNRVCKHNAVKLFTSTMPFACDIINSQRKAFRYDMVWNKINGANILSSNKQPLKIHEQVLVFYDKMPYYNPEGEKLDKPTIVKQTRPVTSKSSSSSVKLTKGAFNEDGSIKERIKTHKNKKSIIKFKRSKSYGNGTSKPLELLKYLINTYTNPGDLILDPVTGSGTTAIAAFELDREFIGFEMNNEQYNIALTRIKNETF